MKLLRKLRKYLKLKISSESLRTKHNKISNKIINSLNKKT